MTLGVHFALAAKDMNRVLAIEDPEELVDLISEDLEERYLEDDEWSYQSDKAWDAIHRCLSDGSLRHQSGAPPSAQAVLGGHRLDAGDDYVACVLQPEQARQVSASLMGITRDWLRTRYESLTTTDYDGPMGDDDFNYTWENFEGLRGFYAKAAEAGRGVMFTASG